VATLVRNDGGSIQLASEPPFRLGALAVTPALRQVAWGGEQRTLEPRVMQVLVALGREPGAIVSRDQLVERCWDGRIVGENAIQRTISLLRQLAVDSGAFEIETITKVGYRLKVAAASSVGPQAPAASRAELGRRAVIAGGAAAALLAGGAAWWISDRPRAEARRLHAAGMELQRQGEDTTLRQAISYFERAVARDPDFAQAWGDLAMARLAMFDFLDEREHGRAAAPLTAAAERALQLDPGNRAAILALALYRPHFRRLIEAEAGLRRALIRLPDEPRLHDRLGDLYGDVGRWRAAAARYAWLAARQPLVPEHQLNLARALLHRGDRGRAEQLVRGASQAWPTSPDVWIALFNFHLLHGRPEEALAMLDRPAPGVGGLSPLPEKVALATARARTTGAERDRQAALQSILDAREKRSMSSILAIPYLVALGALDEAWRLIDTLYFGYRDPATGRRQPLPELAWRRTDFLFTAASRPLWEDSRFGWLTAALGLDAYWKASGTRPDFP